jgi:biotin carboxyl carrier protein
MSKMNVTIDGVPFDVDVRLEPDGSEAVVEIDGATLRVALTRPGWPEQAALALVDGRPYEIAVDPQMHWLRSARGLHRLELRDTTMPVARPASGDGRVKAPIPGLIARLLVAPGDHVEVGQPLLVLEAMKMENEIRAPRPGAVERLDVVEGQQVTLGMLMAEIV